MQEIDSFRLANNVSVPSIGLGTYPMRGQQIKTVLKEAYDIGYRMIDTADNYYNESDIGGFLKHLYSNASAKREDFFLISKLSDDLYSPNELGGGLNKGLYFWKNSAIMQGEGAVHRVVKKKVEESLSNLNTNYLDLLLMHWPYPDFFEEIWYEMERLYKNGVVRAIGVCNCRERHLEQLLKSCRIVPMVNQIETSPINTKDSLLEYCRGEKIQIMVYSPLQSLKVVDDAIGYKTTLCELSKKYSKESAQIILRYNYQRGLISLPKSSNKERLKKNIDIYDFKISESDMLLLNKCNYNRAYLPESKSCPGL